MSEIIDITIFIVDANLKSLCCIADALLLVLFLFPKLREIDSFFLLSDLVADINNILTSVIVWINIY